MKKTIGILCILLGLALEVWVCWHSYFYLETVISNPETFIWFTLLPILIPAMIGSWSILRFGWKYGGFVGTLVKEDNFESVEELKSADSEV